MSDLKFCQGPECHTYFTQDRLQGITGSKTYQTRRRSHMYYGRGNFCDRRCMEDWVAQYIDQALDHYGRTTARSPLLPYQTPLAPLKEIQPALGKFCVHINCRIGLALCS